MDEQVLFVGLGNLGHYLVEYLHRSSTKRDMPLYIHDIDLAVAAKIGQRIGAISSTIDQIPVKPTVVCLCLPGSEAIRSVVSAAENRGLLYPGSIVLDISSVPPSFAREFAAELGERGIFYLEAPVTGALVAAKAGELVTMVSGSSEALARVRWILETFSSRIIEAGTSGSASLLKTVSNLIGNVAAVAAMEGIAVLRKAGVSDGAILEVLNNGPAATYFSSTRYPNYIMPGTFDSGSKMGLVNKDLGIAMYAIQELGSLPPLSLLARELWRGALTKYGKDGDMTMMIDHVCQLSFGMNWVDVIDQPAQ